MSMKGTFFFSERQKSRTAGKIALCRLDSGEVVEYTEMSSVSNDGCYDLPHYKCRPFLERFTDGKILGEGEVYSINGVRQ